MRRSPRSHFDTNVCVSRIFRASCTCVSPARSRSSRRTLRKKSGSGQGLIFNAITEARADTNAPAGAGDYLVLYALGLGAVTPSLSIGNGTPSSPYEYAVAPVTVTIGGVPATVLFAGLTPGYVGLYQVNVMMPTGVAPGSQVPVTVSVAGKSGAGIITIATH
jgi:uncharacterized protein (TIGR03437 family)